MRLALTGGGTGGHVYPAIEVGRLAQESGDDVRYYGSLRGIEGQASSNAGIPFQGFAANPIPRLASAAGVKSVIELLRSASEVKKCFKEWRPDALLATGGYSSVPSLRAARSLGVPIILHEQNTVPGRAIRSMGAVAAKICIVFKKTYEYFPREKVVETGMPIRRELAEMRSTDSNAPLTTLVVGGSQGARALNTAVVDLAKQEGEGRWIHVAGPKLFDEVSAEIKSMPSSYKLERFFSAEEMAGALSQSELAIARSGCGTIAEFAVFGIPAIFVPLPTSFANHQFYNAKEIEGMGAATVVEQGNLGELGHAWREWYADSARRETASKKLRAWAKPDAAARVLQVVKEVAG